MNLRTKIKAAMRLPIWTIGATAVLLAPLCLYGCSSKPPTTPLANKSAPAQKGPVESAAETAVRTNPADPLARLALAKEYGTQGETFAGIEQLEVGRTLAPKNSDILRELATAYDSLSETERAAEILTAAPTEDATLLQLAGLYLKAGDFSRSAQTMQKLTTVAPAQLARALLLAGKTQLAAKVIQKGSTDPEMLAMEGTLALAEQRWKDAEVALKRSYQISKDPWTGYLLAKAELKTGQADTAYQDLRAAIQSPNSPPQAAILLADVALTHNQAEEANAALNLIKGSDRRLPQYWQTSAREAQKRSHTEAAQMMLGYAAYNSGDPWAAEKIWGKIAEGSNPGMALQASIAATNCALRRQDPDSALKFAKAGAQRWPSDPETNRLYAETLLAMSQPSEALAPAQKFQANAPQEKQAQAAELLCRIGLDTDKPDLVTANADRALQLAPSEPMPLLHQAEMLAKQGKDTAALKKTLSFYERAGMLAPNNAEAAAHGGLIMADLKRNVDAEHTLLHSLSLNPRVLDGAANAVLIKLYQADKKSSEVAFEAMWYQRLRQLKDPWPTVLKTMRQAAPSSDAAAWKALAELALSRHENWIALCATRRWTALKPSDSAAWQSLASAQKRFGMFDDALESMLLSQQGAR